ncbi:MAG TPA: flavodoxin family protein [Acidimicrobiia bacterium]|nr:flavodoxin family protein [Acidimicrobiia bacterium]
MRALVVYESMYGRTREIAHSVAQGLRSVYEVDTVHVDDATPELVENADLLVVGGPTHVHGMTSQRSRTAAVDAAANDSELTLDEHAPGEGLRQWLAALEGDAIAEAAAFDTRIDASPMLTGRASRGIAKRLHRAGYRMIADPESFLVDSHSRLLPGEVNRARAWGESLCTTSHGAVPKPA